MPMPNGLGAGDVGGCSSRPSSVGGSVMSSEGRQGWLERMTGEVRREREETGVCGGV